MNLVVLCYASSKLINDECSALTHTLIMMLPVCGHQFIILRYFLYDMNDDIIAMYSMNGNINERMWVESVWLSSKMKALSIR
jgi:hypothetical protein